MSTSQSWLELFSRAAEGDKQSLGQLLQRYRPYLRLLAQRQVEGPLGARLDASDLVQTTFLEASRDLPRFHGDTEAQWMAWLRAILNNNIAQAVEKHIQAKKRAVDKERRFDDGSGSRALAAADLPGFVSSPSQRAMRGEQAVRLAAALLELPDDQQTAVRLRHLEGWPLKKIAQHMDRSEVAVAGLIKRGLRALRGGLSN